MLDRDTGEEVRKTLPHDGDAVREFCASLVAPVVVGIEATGTMVSPVDGAARDHLSCRTSDGDSQGGDAAAET
jgi:hypothetical protein